MLWLSWFLSFLILGGIAGRVAAYLTGSDAASAVAILVVMILLLMFFDSQSVRDHFDRVKG
jgi:hypothetical protein